METKRQYVCYLFLIRLDEDGYNLRQAIVFPSSCQIDVAGVVVNTLNNIGCDPNLSIGVRHPLVTSF